MSRLVDMLLKGFLTNPLFVSIIVLGLIAAIFQKQILGWFGEHWTKQALKKLPKDKYKVINDVLILVDGCTHQIDHVVVSSYGIFSIETKQYNGYIIGSKYDKNWVRHIGKKKYYYTNPIRQNYGHVKALSSLLKIDDSMVHNIVCIPSNARLKIKHDGELVRNYNIVEKILSYKDVLIDDIDVMVSIIAKNNILDKKAKKEHIRNIHENIIKNNQTNCPKCGGQLVERNCKYGSFIGCSNYPKCKYTENNNKSML